MSTYDQSSRPTKALLLTCQFSHGHERPARAVERALTQRQAGVVCEYLDLWSLVDDTVAAALQEAHERLIRDYPHYYRRLCDLDKGLWRQLTGAEPMERDLQTFLLEFQHAWFPDRGPGTAAAAPGKDLDRALVNSLIRLLCADRKDVPNRVVVRGLLLFIRSTLLQRLERRLASIKPDVIVATHMYPAALMAQLKRGNGFHNLPVVGTVTDFGLQTVWARPATDLYCVAGETLKDQLVRCGVSRRRIYQTGLPLMPAFKQPPSQAEARHRLGIAPNRYTVLVTNADHRGSSGRAVQELIQSDVDCQVLVAAASSNDQAWQGANLGEAHNRSLKLFEGAGDMSVLLSAADVVVGEPSGLSVGEALACGRPFIAMEPLGGQEHHNVAYLERYNVGREVQPGRLAAGLQRLFANPRCLRRMQSRAEAVGQREGADKVAMLVEQLSQGEQRRHGWPQEY